MQFKYNTPTQKLTRKDLQFILNVSYNTAKKEYQTLLDCLNLKRNFLIVNDLIDLKIMS